MNAIQLFVVPRVMPPGLEAATFEAVAKIPGIRLDDEVDALGRRGIGVSYPKLSFTFIFDSETYAYLGLRLKGSTVIAVGKGFRSVGWYHEMRSLQELRVVDRIGQRRPGNAAEAATTTWTPPEHRVVPQQARGLLRHRPCSSDICAPRRTQAGHSPVGAPTGRSRPHRALRRRVFRVHRNS